MARRVQKKLTEREIAAAKPPPKGQRPRRYSDGGNLYLVVADSGAKHWSLIYKLPGQNPRQLGLGPLEHVDAKAARAKAEDARRLIFVGEDPMETMGKRKGAKAKAAPAHGRTFEEVAEAAIRAFEPGWSNDKTGPQWRSSLKMYAYPKLGPMRLSEITTADVHAVLELIWTTKPETAARVRARIEAVLDRAAALKLRHGPNPAAWKGNLDALLAPRGKVRKVTHHPALPYAEVGGFMAELRGREGTSARALEFAILCAARTSEVLGARWSEIDLAAKTWVVPPERMKARREHAVPLSKAAIDLLKKLPREKGVDLVFIGPTRDQPMSNMAMLKLLERMGRDDLTVHGFRSSFRSWAAEQTSFPAEVAEHALAHLVGSAVERSYQRSSLFDRRRKLMAAWAGYCAVAQPAKKASNVTAIGEAAAQ